MILPGIGGALAIGSSSYPASRGSVQASTQTNPSSFSPTLPTHDSGDVLLVFVAGGGTGALSATGWTKKGEVTAGTHRLALFSKTAASSSTTITITGFISEGGGDAAAHAYALTGAEGTVLEADAASIDPPSLSATWGSALTMWLVGAATASAPASAPSGFGNAVQTSVAGVVLSTADKNDSSASLNPATFSSAGSNPATMTVAVRPL